MFYAFEARKKIISRSCAQICYTPNLYTLTTPFALSEYGVHEDHIEKESFKIQEISTQNFKRINKVLS